jgi:hypothetical protein
MLLEGHIFVSSIKLPDCNAREHVTSPCKVSVCALQISCTVHSNVVVSILLYLEGSKLEFLQILTIVKELCAVFYSLFRQVGQNLKIGHIHFYSLLTLLFIIILSFGII